MLLIWVLWYCNRALQTRRLHLIIWTKVTRKTAVVGITKGAIEGRLRDVWLMALRQRLLWRSYKPKRFFCNFLFLAWLHMELNAFNRTGAVMNITTTHCRHLTQFNSAFRLSRRTGEECNTLKSSSNVFYTKVYYDMVMILKTWRERRKIFGILVRRLTSLNQ